ncbi:clostripain-related cysteine peptidase, partial [bacterium]|nr:clostripain-related cysteine peptidase [bacterium]
KLDILAMDACLMSMFEVAYELKDSVSYLLASQENEPGTGYPYAEILNSLNHFEAMTPRALSRTIVHRFVKSYRIGGTGRALSKEYITGEKSDGFFGKSATLAAWDLNNLNTLKNSLADLSKYLQQHTEVARDLLLGIEYKRFSHEDYADLYDFTKKSLLYAKDNQNSELQTIIHGILLAIGYPSRVKRSTDQQVLLKSDIPLYLYFSLNQYNNFNAKEYGSSFQQVSDNLARIPLQFDGNNKYFVSIQPFKRIGKGFQSFFVKQFHYYLSSDRDLQEMPKAEVKTIRSKAEYRVVQHFSKFSPLVIEGHTQGNGDAHGISIYLPKTYNNFNTAYFDMQFSKDTNWGQWLQKRANFVKRNNFLISSHIHMASSRVQQFLKNQFKSRPHDLMLFGDEKELGFDSVYKNYQTSGVIIIVDPQANKLSQPDLQSFVEDGGKVLVLVSKEDPFYDYFFEDPMMIKHHKNDHQHNKSTFLLNDNPVKIEGHELTTLSLTGDNSSGLLACEDRFFAVKWSTKNGGQMVYSSLPIWNLSPELQKEVFDYLLMQLK